MPRAKRAKAGMSMKRIRRHRPMGRPAGTAPLAGGVAVQSVLGELQLLHGDLVAQRAALDGQIGAVEQALKAIGAPVRRGPGRPALSRPAMGRPALGRPRAVAVTPTGRGVRSGSLKDYIQQVLTSGGTHSVKDITEGVLAAGYKSKNKTLAKSVGIALTEMSNVRKVARGTFSLR